MGHIKCGLYVISIKFAFHGIIWTCRCNVHVHMVRKTFDTRSEPGNYPGEGSPNWKGSKEIVYSANFKFRVD